MEEDQRFKSTVTEILPNTLRNQNLKARRQAEESQKKAEQDKILKAQREKEQERRQQLRDQERRAKYEEEKRAEDMRRQLEEKQQISTLKGKFGHMINNLQEKQTMLEYTISGLQLMDAQIRILSQNVGPNSTLKCLSIIRKNENEGVEIAKNLKENVILEKLELEGNQFGPKTAFEIGELLKKNNVIRYIDLEFNNLTNYNPQGNAQYEIEGIKNIGEALKVNSTVLYLNLNKTNLNKECGELLLDAMKQNKTLIMLDIEANNKMDIEHVKAIQDILVRNKQDFDNERFTEFIERKRMKREEDLSSIQQMEKEAQDVINQGINLRIDMMRQKMEDDWQKELEAEQVKLLKEMAKLEKESKLRGGKKKKRKRK